MKITESQLRKIIKSEIIRESRARQDVELWAKDHYPGGPTTLRAIESLLSDDGYPGARASFVAATHGFGGTYGYRSERDSEASVRVEHPGFEGGWIELTREEAAEMLLGYGE